MEKIRAMPVDDHRSQPVHDRRERASELKKQSDEQPSTFRSSAELRAMYRAERKIKKAGLGRIIASRVLTEENARDNKIIIVIGAPRRAEVDH